MSGEWRRVTVDEIAVKISMGPFGSDIKTDNFVSCGVPVIRGGNLTTGRFNGEAFVFLTDAKADELMNSNAYPGDIIFTHRGTLGQVGLVPDIPFSRYVVSQSQLKLTCDRRVAEPVFVYYYFKSPEGQTSLLANTSQTGVPAISRPVTSLKSIDIPLPPLPEQRRIAKILGDLDDKIELNRKMNETLEQMARALFKSWFIDFDPVRAKMDGRMPEGMDADTAALFPSRLVESELGLVPEGWEVKALGDVVECIGGGTPSTKEGSYWNGGAINWATPKDLSSLQAPLLTATERSITDSGLTRVASGLLPARTLLMSSRAPVGYLAISTIPVAINQGFIAMPESSVMTSLYMLHWCNANMIEIQGRASGTTFAELSKSNFRQMRMLLPSGQLVKTFSHMVSYYYNQIETNIHQSRTLASLRDTMLPKLMAGRIDLC